jgi:UDP:flavonoid glycosyltransferase YjiC (YdhE family)
MRVLITTSGGAGHLGPLVPFADAVRSAGGEVLVATRESMAAPSRAAGYDIWTFADAAPEARDPFFERARQLTFDEANVLVVAEVFARLDGGAALPRVLEACEQWRPDVVLSEVCEFAGPLAAELAGVPAVRVGIGLASLEDLVIEPASAALQDLRAEIGLPADPRAERITGLPYFTLTPALMEDPASPGANGARRFRELDAAAADPLPDWWPGDAAPLVYLTLGSVVPQGPFFPGLYRAALDALAPLPVRVLVTIGRDRDPADLGPVPANVHVERWVPQAAVMPHAAAMVCHGGFGTVRAGLTAGMPMAVLPLFADQPYNARRVADLGAGIQVDGAEGVGDAVRALLDDPRYARGAAAVAEEVRSLPTVEQAAGILRGLASR